MAVHYASEGDTRINKVILTAPVVINNWKNTKHLTGILNPSARLVRASKKFAREIYELWLKSMTLNLSNHYRSMLESSIGSAEMEKFKNDGTFEVLVNSFREAASNNLKGISSEMVHCITPMKISKSKLTFPVEVWYGTEDKRMTLDGIKLMLEDFENHTLHVRDGYSEHIYFSLFEEIVSA